MRGLTIPRPVHVKSIHHMGKEVIADPTDTPEDLTAELLNATDPVIYRDKGEESDALRAQIKATGVKAIARKSGVSRSRLQAFVNERKTLHSSTLAKIDSAIDVLGSASSNTDHQGPNASARG